MFKVSYPNRNHRWFKKGSNLPDSQTIIYLCKITGWQYSELAQMLIDDLIYWCRQAIKYGINSRNTLEQDEC